MYIELWKFWLGAGLFVTMGWCLNMVFSIWWKVNFKKN